MSLGRRTKTKKELKNETKMDENQNKKNEKKIKFGIKFFLAFEKIKKFCIQRMKVLTTTVAIVTLLFTAVQPLLLLLPVPVAIIIFIVGVILINEILLFTQKSEKNESNSERWVKFYWRYNWKRKYWRSIST